MFFKTKAEKKANYLLKMVLLQNERYEKKDNRKSFFISGVINTFIIVLLFSWLGNEQPFPVIYAFVSFILIRVYTGNRGCSVEHSGTIHDAVEVESLNLLFELLPKHKETLSKTSEKRINSFISHQKSYIKNDRKYQDPHLNQLAKQFVFELENLKEVDGVEKRQKTIAFQEEQLKKIKQLGVEKEKELMKRKKELKDFCVIKTTKELNEIKETAPNVMVVD